MGFVQQPHSMEAPPSPLSSRPELRRSVVERSAVQRSFPGNGFCSATTLNGSTALPFVISTGAPKERSGEICGPAVLSWECFSTERTRIPYFALLATTTCLALSRESRMQLISATELDRKSGGSQSRDLCVDALSWKYFRKSIVRKYIAQSSPGRWL